jgi:hypothetical protein
MIKKYISSFLVVLVIIGLAAFLHAGTYGKHTGEQKQLDVSIDFQHPSGITTTNADGTYYKYYGYVIYEDKVYPEEYWGDFPLYFVGKTAYIKVRLNNSGPRAKAKIRIKTEAYTLRTDGSSGIPLMEPIIQDIVLSRGEVRTVDSSFKIDNLPGLESGLDRFIVKVLHMSEGGKGKGNPEPSLIMQKEGVFCPPKP